jgi:hypothetical protein|eukprot:CAMPEP_0168313720 /NCGR_PEP_ID=MMETSP0210-20121227/3824_1 /TAXON_ID=40633 /ORGANISM="Condylostoma magnum, Strain COL2" /LENGTH=56 /DNA_ID=CAMNT_0008273761 /DNA_START=398 /DNA_END=568 /DNA_ORIENTATION=+
MEKEQFEKELEFLGLDGKGDRYNRVAKDAMADEEAKKKMDMRREMMMGIALVGGDN